MKPNEYKPSGSIHSLWRSAAAMSFMLIVLSLGSETSAAELPPFESNPEFRASKILSPELLRSEHHTVQEKVTNDGFLNYYVVQTPFGNFSAEGNRLLKQRIQEARALAELEQVSHSDLFIQAAARTLKQPVEALDQFVDEPVETVKGIPGGLSRKFKSISRKVKSGTKDSSDAGEDEDGQDSSKDQAQDYASTWFGVSGAERRWASQARRRSLYQQHHIA